MCRTLFLMSKPYDNEMERGTALHEGRTFYKSDTIISTKSQYNKKQGLVLKNSTQ